jgi:hypothetical protein
VYLYLNYEVSLGGNACTAAYLMLVLAAGEGSKGYTKPIAFVIVGSGHQ